jgi:Glyoxalase-like domain
MPMTALTSESVRHIDHLIFAAPDLEDGVREIMDRFGVRAAGGGQHLGQGTHNKLLALGPRTYLEIIAPDPAQPEPSQPRPYGVNGVTTTRLVGWAIACDDIVAARGEARAAGFDPGGVIDGYRGTPEGTMLRWQATSNARTAGVIPFLISWGNSTTHPAASAPPGLQLESLHIEHPEPESIVRALRALGSNVDVVDADQIAIVARVTGAIGGYELR